MRTAREQRYSEFLPRTKILVIGPLYSDEI